MLYSYNNTNQPICQEEISEVDELLTANTLDAFRRHRRYREKYAELIYPTMNENQRILWDTCSTDIWVRNDGTVSALNSCRNRFCAVCNWRAARKRYSYTYRAMQELENEGEYAYLFATMTLKNCADWQLPEYIDMMMQGINRMQSTRTWRRRVLGYIRQLEITYNESADTYHPHYHYILCVPKSYFTDPDLYLDTAEWRKLWERSLRLDYTAQYDLQGVQAWDENALIGQICEISKYQLKLSSVIESGQGFPVRVIADAIKGRRMVAYGGIYKIINLRLKNEDKAALTDKIEGTHFHFNGNDYEVGTAQGATRPSYLSAGKLEHELLRSRMKAAIKAANEGEKQRHKDKPKIKPNKQEITLEERKTRFYEVESELIQMLDSPPKVQHGQKWDAWRLKKARLRRSYERLKGVCEV